MRERYTGDVGQHNSFRKLQSLSSAATKKCLQRNCNSTPRRKRSEICILELFGWFYLAGLQPSAVRGAPLPTGCSGPLVLEPGTPLSDRGEENSRTLPCCTWGWVFGVNAIQVEFWVRAAHLCYWNVIENRLQCHLQ